MSNLGSTPNLKRMIHVAPNISLLVGLASFYDFVFVDNFNTEKHRNEPFIDSSHASRPGRILYRTWPSRRLYIRAGY